MTTIVLISQKAQDLTKDEQITHLTITRAWLEADPLQQLSILSQLYPNIKSINLSDLNLLRSPPSLFTSIAMAFPEINELVLEEGAEHNLELMKQISIAFKSLTKMSFSKPPQYSQDSFSYFNPMTWDLSFWESPQTPAAGSPPQHHDTTRDLFNVSDISKGQSNIVSDWNRISRCVIEINGSSIFNLVSADINGKYFPTRDSLKLFFLEHLLGKLHKEQQSKAIDYVMKTLHQGGLQNPVTAAIYQYCSRKDSSPQPVDASNIKNGIPGQYRAIKFNATDEGFTVHETLTQNRLAFPITAGDDAGKLVLPDEGHSYVFKAEAKLTIQWTVDSDEPQLSVNDVGITFGSTLAKDFLDERWFYQKWIDNMGYYTGLNTVVEDIPPTPTLGM